MRKIQFWLKNGEKFEFTQKSKKFLKFNTRIKNGNLSRENEKNGKNR